MLPSTSTLTSLLMATTVSYPSISPRWVVFPSTPSELLTNTSSLLLALVVQELIASDIYSELIQPFSISHSLLLSVYNGTEETVDLSTLSATTLSFVDESSVTIVEQATPTPTASVTATANSQNGTIGSQVESFVDELLSAMVTSS